MKNNLRSIPPIHELQKEAEFRNIIGKFHIEEKMMTEIVKAVLDHIRTNMIKNTWQGPLPGDPSFISYIFNEAEKKLKNRFSYKLKRVINATGTIVHTNLGRARLSERAIEHVTEIAGSYSNLEYKLAEGERGSRHSHIEQLIKEITGAEAAMVVNNNAAAVYLVLRELAKEKEVIVSRGELVEIGGSFRISSIMEESGAYLVEVGTTNKTHLYDYERAINEETAVIMKVHTSNFKIVGFTESVSREELAGLTAKHDGIIFYEDLGSGALYDYSLHGIGNEPVVKEVLRSGVDVVSFSGDKLLGGPQAGIIAGKKEIIDRLKKNQLARVVRVDKMTLAALEGTLIDYMRGIEGLKNIPVARDLLLTKEEIGKRATAFNERLSALTDAYELSLAENASQVGGGTMPGVELPTYVSVLKPKYMEAEKIAKKLRTEFDPAIIVRIQKDEILIDLRCITEQEEKIVIDSLAAVADL